MNNRIKIKFGQIEFEAEGDAELIERERQQFFSLLPHAVSAVFTSKFDTEENKDIPTLDEQDVEIPLLVSSSNGNVQSYESLPALFKDKSFSTDVERILGVAYFLDQIRGISPFNVKDIEEALSDARQQKPSNINAFVNCNIQKSYIIPVKEKKDGQKSFKISSDGIEWINSYEPGERKIKKTVTKRKVTKTDTNSPYDLITREDLNLHNYPQVKRLADFKQKMLMVMHIYTNEKKGEYFTTSDIVSIMTNVFGEKATKDQVAGVFKRETDWFNKVPDELNKKAMKYKMLNGAMDFVATILEPKNAE